MIKQVALYDNTNMVSFAELKAVAKALSVQTQRDFDSVWGESAEVTAFANKADIPSNYYHISIETELDVSGLLGYHWYDDKAKKPFALIKYRKDWSITASHELLEMLVNPTLNRYQVTDITPDLPGNENFLLEVAGPVQDQRYSYMVEGVLVSNFVYPSYFDITTVEGKRYDHLGQITMPRSILYGGYVSFIDNVGQWWQAFNIQNKITLKKLFAGDTSTDHLSRVLRIVFFGVTSAVLVFFIYKIFKRK